jgi:hypothetical protein
MDTDTELVARAKMERDQWVSYVMPRRLQLVAMGVTLLCVGAILYRVSYRFTSWENIPALITLTPKEIAQCGILPADIQVSLFLRNFTGFDVVKSAVVADMTVRFTFDARQLTVDRLKDFSFDHGEIIRKSDPRIRLQGDLTVLSYDVRVQFTPSFNYRMFPFDGHQLFITLAPGPITPAEALFTAMRNDFLLGNELNTSGWSCVSRRVVAGYTEEKLEQNGATRLALYPRIQYSLSFSRSGIRHIISLVMPFLLIFFISLLGFSLAPYENSLQGILALSTLSITALIAYCFVIESMSPQTGYMMVSDKLFLLFLALVSVVFFVNVFSFKITKRAKITIAYILHVTLVGALLYFTW